MAFNDVIIQNLYLLTLIGDIIIIAILLILFLVNMFFPKKINLFKNKFVILIQKKALLFAWIVSLLAVLGSLFFSNVVGYVPCTLCWYQRIFMYPLVIILGIAYFTKDVSIRKYLIPISIVGGLFSIYHYFVQMSENVSSLATCTVGEGASCGVKYAVHFGYITIPIMALTAFVLIIIFLDNAKK